MMTTKSFSFGGQTLSLNYPSQAASVIAFCFPHLQDQNPANGTSIIDIWFNKTKVLFNVDHNGKRIGSDLDQANLALLLLKRSSDYFSHAIDLGPALPGTAVQHNGNGLLIIGDLGNGKTMLTTWLMAKEYGYLTDELVYFPDEGNRFYPLTRPLHVKQSAFDSIEDLIPLQKEGELFFQNSEHTLCSHKIIDDCPVPQSQTLSLFLFLKYKSNSPLSLDVISPGRAAQRLIGNLMNSKNLTLHGFPKISSLTRQIPALSLQYGSFMQLEKVLEPILNFILEKRCSPSSLTDFVNVSHLFNTEHRRRFQLTDKDISCKDYPIQEPTPVGKKRKLTIGMATYDDYEGVYFSVQALRMYHPEVTRNTEILVIDNHPDGPCAESLKNLDKSIDGYRYMPVQDIQGTAVRDCIFHHATGDFVLCMDCHVFLVPGAIQQLIDYLKSNPTCKDLLQGPMVHDDMKAISTHFKPVWQQGMYGVWDHDTRAENKDGEPFEIPMQGLGLFCCRKESWPGLNPRFRGFGGEEGYIHEKFRQAGGRTLCLPFLRWLHRFNRPMGIPYLVQWEDRIYNYLVGFQELGFNSESVTTHFSEVLGEHLAEKLFEEIEKELTSPFHYFDAIYCITLNTKSVRWQNMQKRFKALNIEKRIRVFNAIETPENHHIGCALSHRAILVAAKQQNLKNVLVFEDDAIFLDETLFYLKKSISELEGQRWNIFYLGGHKWNAEFTNIPGCTYLQQPVGLTTSHALAYNNTVYDQILQELPYTVDKMALWLKEHHGIDQFLRSIDNLLITSPVVASQEPLLGQEKKEHRHRFTLGSDGEPAH